MDETRDGGCLCGAVRFRTTGAPVRMGECHCTDCLKVSGGAPAYLVGLRTGQLEVLQGHAAGYAVTGASGKAVTRFFCQCCGAPLWSVPEAYPDLLYVKVGAFDRFEGFRPEFAVWTDSAPDWHVVPAGVARFGKARA